jgi:hypothetical protein
VKTTHVFIDCKGTELRRVSESEFEAINAVGYHVAKQHTCMISKEGTHPEPIGSGTFIRIDSNLFVATAKHLFEGFDRDDLVGIYWGKDDNRAGANIDSIIVDEAHDLAAIPLPSDTPASGWPLNPANESDADLFVLSGIPAEKCDIDLNSKSLYVGHFSLGCIELPPNLWPTNPEKPIQSNVDLLLNYTRNYATDDLGDPMNPIAPFGMSGGGIWSVPKNTDSVWAPEEARLIAIQSSVESSQWRYLRAIRIEPWLKMLSAN